MARGDPGPFFELYSDSADATLANPHLEPARGRVEIEAAGRLAASNYREGRAIAFETSPSCWSETSVHTRDRTVRGQGRGRRGRPACRASGDEQLSPRDGRWRLLHGTRTPLRGDGRWTPCFRPRSGARTDPAPRADGRRHPTGDPTGCGCWIRPIRRETCAPSERLRAVEAPATHAAHGTRGPLPIRKWAQAVRFAARLWMTALVVAAFRARVDDRQPLVSGQRRT